MLPQYFVLSSEPVVFISPSIHGKVHTIELPREALAHSHNISYMVDQQTIRAQRWFPREPAAMPLIEMTVVAGNYDYTLTLLLMPEAEWQGAHHDDDEPLEDELSPLFVTIVPR
jgi:hypothetical protein